MLVHHPSHAHALQALAAYLDFLDESVPDYIQHSHRIVTPDLGLSFQRELTQAREALLSPLGPDRGPAMENVVQFWQLAGVERDSNTDPEVLEDLQALRKMAMKCLVVLMFGLPDIQH